MYVQGLGVDVDYKKAFPLCMKGALMGYKIAMELLSYYYLNGIGVEVNKTEAKKWADLAAKTK